jgi:hypothetical protein
MLLNPGGGQKFRFAASHCRKMLGRDAKPIWSKGGWLVETAGHATAVGECLLQARGWRAAWATLRMANCELFLLYSLGIQIPREQDLAVWREALSGGRSVVVLSQSLILRQQD